MRQIFACLVFVVFLEFAVLPAWALNPSLPPGSNFDLSHWDLQLPTDNGVLTGASGNVDTFSPSQLTGGATNAYFYTGPDGAMTFWAPDDGARTGGSTHPRSELREELIPNNSNTNWTLNGTHVMTATCVVSNVPSDTGKVCIGQIHEPNNKPDGSTSANNEQMIMFDLPNQQIYAHVEVDGNAGNSFSQTLVSGSGVALGKPINYTMSVVNGLLTIIINNVTNSWNLFGGTNSQGEIFTNWGAASGNTEYFKAGDYNQTDDTCGCSTDGSLVAFYSLTLYHAPSITNQPASLAANAGSNATFAVGASGNGTLSYQWWFNATNSLARATNASLTVTNVAGTNAGNYTVVVSDNTSSFSSITSAVATLTINIPPSITNQPASLVVNVGSTATFTVGAAGTGLLSYQWWFNATNRLVSGTNASLTITNAASTNAGNYTVVVTNGLGSVTSAVVTLTVNAIYQQTTVVFSNAGPMTWICPAGVSSVQIECWSGGGAGGSAFRNPNSGSAQYGGGGAGGAYARLNSYAVTAGHTYYINVGTGGVAATGTLTNGVKMTGGDSWFNSVNSEPASAGNCVAKGGDGGECAVGNTSTTAFGAGGTGTTNGSFGDVLFAGGSGGTQTSTSNGYGGGGGGSGGTNSAGNAGTITGTGATAVPGGGNGGNPNVTMGSSGPGQAPTNSPGGGGGGARAATTTQLTGGNGTNGQVVLTYSIGAATTPAFSGLTASPSIIYGAASVTLSGMVSGTNGGTPVYPASGEAVSASINGHSVNGSITNTTGRFSITYNDASLATNGVGGSPYVITYAYAGNGSILAAATNDTSTSLTVNQATATVSSGLTANNKPYDGTAVATISSNNVVLTGVVPGDSANVKLTTNGYTAAFSSTSVGINKPVTVNGLTLTGTAATNYTLTQPTNLTANISAVPAAAISIPGSGVPNITFFGIPNTNYVVQVTTNLVAPWQPVGTNTAGSNGSWLFTDFQATNFTQRFYRLVTP